MIEPFLEKAQALRMSDIISNEIPCKIDFLERVAGGGMTW
jgi:hypothetical protein